MRNKSTILIHAYASPYYDPVKAHEYYEEHKKLKGNGRNTSTASLNETGKKAALYVKKQIDDEKESETKQLKNSTLDKVKQANEQTKSEIEKLKVQLKKMNPAQKKQAEIRIKAEIEKLKKANKENRNILMEEYKTNAKTASEKYYNKYADELDAMKNDTALLKAKTSGKKSSSGKEGKYTFVYRRSAEEQKKSDEKYGSAKKK